MTTYRFEQPRFDQPSFRNASPSPTQQPAASPSGERPAGTGTAMRVLTPQVLSPRDVTGMVDPGGTAMELGSPIGVPCTGSPRAARKFERTAEALANGWGHLASAAKSRAEARNATALSIQRAAEIGAAARKAVDDAALHHAKTFTEIAEFQDAAIIREATREDRVLAAMARARFDRTKLGFEANELRERSAATCAQQRLVAAQADFGREALADERTRERRKLAEEERLEA
ncbi:MAG: hypothetical protein ABIT01_02995, partial [Thermoanaerobaculia bacterium]